MQSGLKHNQRGATFLGILTILSIVMLAVYAGIRLVPLYLDHFAVIKAMKDTAQSLQGGEINKSTIIQALDKRWTVEYISTLNYNDIEITPVPKGIQMRAVYETRAPFIANVSLVVEFDDSVTISTGGSAL